MIGLGLALAVSLAGTSPVATSYALFGADKPTIAKESPAADQTIDRATKALDRPPGAIPQIHTEGTLPGHGIRDISQVAKQDQLIAFDLALAWRLTNDRRYLETALRYLDAWASVYQISFNPIDETGFDTMIFATDLTRSGQTPVQRAKIDGFWRRMAAGYLDAMDGEPKNASSNWQSHRVKLAAIAAFETGDAELIARARSAFRRQIAVNILPDGSVLDFHDRDALHYVTYDLEPLLMAALAAKAHGEDWFHWRAPSGASLPIALRWLEPYATGAQTHTEFVHSTVRFDRQRATAGDPEYGPHLWDRANAVRPFSVAALCDPAYARFAQNLAQASGRQPSAWVKLFRW